MVTLNNNLNNIGKTLLADLLVGRFFEYESEIYQFCCSDEPSGTCLCCRIPDLKCSMLESSIYVRQVDVHITVTGYSKED